MANFEAIVRSLIGPQLNSPQSANRLRQKFFGNVGQNIRKKLQDASTTAQVEAADIWRQATGRLASPIPQRDRVDPARTTPKPSNMPTLTPEPSSPHEEQTRSPQPPPVAPTPTPAQKGNVRTQRLNKGQANEITTTKPVSEPVESALEKLNQAEEGARFTDEELHPVLREAAQRTGLDSNLVIAIQSTEGANVNARGDKDPNDIGLFQINKSVWGDVIRAVVPEVQTDKQVEDWLFNPINNINFATRYVIPDFINKVGADPEAAISAYKGGTGELSEGKQRGLQTAMSIYEQLSSQQG